MEQVRVPLLPLTGLEILTYYYGVYSSSYRGKQRRENREEQETELVLIDIGKQDPIYPEWTLPSPDSPLIDLKGLP